ncbi:MAG: DUF4091 domain-containing protein [Candidatus Hydrogenedens sp.]|nr:DUF4091 domain-containing protein [Candidatus Hydrogenedens sp.]
MNFRASFLIPAMLLSLMALSASAMAAELQVWSVDPLIKVFQDAQPENSDSAADHVARGEYGEFQLVVRCDTVLDDLSVAVSPFTHALSTATLSEPRSRFVGYVNVDRPTQRPSADQLRQPPADYPDVLLEAESLAVPAGNAQPVWIDVSVPLSAAEGAYNATVTVSASVDGEALEAQFPLKVVVYPITLDKTRLWITNWFSMQWRHMEIDPARDSEEYYALLGRYARNMAEHNQNVALISPLNLSRFYIDETGALAVDFSKFDRWVQIFIDEGVIGRIEGGHIGGRSGDWDSDFVTNIRIIREGQVQNERVDPASEEARQFYAFFFPALTAHLKEKGWLDIYMQHLADEPTKGNMDTYKNLAALVHDFAPELRIVEANHTKELVGSMDIWVPQLNYFHDDFIHYKERQEAGDEVWFYTCVFPQGEYANRFIEQPLIKTRLLHWINFASGATGYLHWGYNAWQDTDPVTHTTRPHPGPPYLPAGDPWVVYPGKEGPLDSIRFEAMRDGAFDHELLCRLAEKDPKEATRLVERHILDFDRYETNVALFRETRIALLQALAAIS